MEDQLKNIIIELTSSQLIVNWLELCGFETVEDADNINEIVLKHMEDYIGSICNLMPVDEREKYIETEVYKTYPLNFKISPALKFRLLKASDIIKKQLTKNAQLTNNFKLMSKSLQKFDMNYFAKIGCFPCSQQLHDFVMENVVKTFANFLPVKDFDFLLYEPKTEENNSSKFGFLSCSMRESDQICGAFVKFSFREDDESIDMDSIISHMKTHFTQPDSEHDNSSVARAPLATIGGHINRESISTDLSDVRLCSDQIHSDIIKMASAKFFNCHLVRDMDFNIYEVLNEDLSLSNRGCFLCYLCLKLKATESKIKFFFTSSRSVVNSNIVTHLRKHFQSIGPSSTTSSVRRDSSILKHYQLQLNDKEKSDNCNIKSESMKENAL